MKKGLLSFIYCGLSFFWGLPANATLVGFPVCSGANGCEITSSPPNPVTANPNNGILLAWDEAQNFTLTQDLRVDRVFDPAASFVEADGSAFIIKSGTVVSSHYLQWDPGSGSDSRVDATIALDSQIFAFVTNTQKLFDSDFLGLAGLDYNDFGLRGLESGDTTVFNNQNVDISWSAGSPGDWTRLITAFSPGGSNGGGGSVPEPSTLLLIVLGMVGFELNRRSKSHICGAQKVLC